MSRGQQIIVALALAAVVVISAAMGWFGAQEAHPPKTVLYIGELSPAPDKVHPVPRCSMPVDYDDAVLCAYLRQADAAERGLWYALIQGIFTAGAVVASAFGLLLSARSVSAAFAGNRQARRIGEASARCYVSVTKVQLDLHSDLRYWINLTVENKGNTPAINLEFDFELLVLNMDDEELRITSENMPWQPATLLVSGAKEVISFNISDPVGDPVKLAEIRSVGTNLVVDCEIDGSWEDAFGNKLGVEEVWRAVEGSKFDPISSKMMDRVSHRSWIDDDDELEPEIEDQ